MIYVGTAGWSYQDWKGTVYPKPAGAGFHGLTYLSGFLDCMEVNSTFYRIPEAKSCASWVARVVDRPEFCFTAKLWQGFTHQDESSPEFFEAYREGLAPIQQAGRLAAVLVQFPWSFTDTPQARTRLELLARSLEGFALVPEVRHRSWLAPDAVQLIESPGYNFCNIDQPASSQGIYPTALVTGPLGYVRLHGRSETWFDRQAGRDSKYDYLYQPWELEKWIRRIEQIRARAGRTIVITNNHFRGQAVANAIQLRQMLGLPATPIPELIQTTFPFLL